MPKISLLLEILGKVVYDHKSCSKVAEQNLSGPTRMSLHYKLVPVQYREYVLLEIKSLPLSSALHAYRCRALPIEP